MEITRIVYREHAFLRMRERKVSKEEVRAVLDQGEVIEAYPEDWPFPSQLMLGIVEDRPLHVVAGFDETTGICYIVTVYDPNPDVWSEDFRVRK